MDLTDAEQDPCCAIERDAVAEGGVVADAINDPWCGGLHRERRAIKMDGLVNRSERAAAQRVGAEVRGSEEGARPTFSRKWTERLHVTRGGWELCVIKSRGRSSVRPTRGGVTRGVVLLDH